MTKPIVVGATVRWSRDFLRAICSKTGPEQFAQGVVLAIEVEPTFHLAIIEWTDGTMTRARPGNLSHVGMRESEVAEWNSARVGL